MHNINYKIEIKNITNITQIYMIELLINSKPFINAKLHETIQNIMKLNVILCEKYDYIIKKQLNYICY